ncbi:MAG: tetratricopeptide repeat protein [Acidobacteria bacterium]|nr:tetratricopeptide repeat protein [Acidobacteriota bacterium]
MRVRSNTLCTIMGLKMSRKLLLCLVLLTSSAALTVVLSCVSARSQDIESAEEELRQGKYSAAIAAFNKLLQADPKDARAQWGLIQSYLETGQYADAERQAKKYLPIKENEPQTRLLIGEIYAITGRYQEAIVEFEKARNTEEIPIKLRADLRRAEILEMTGKEEAAQELYQTFAEYYKDESPDSADELTMIANALTHLERYQDANEVYLEAIASDEKFIDAQLGGGELYTAKYHYADAAEFFNDALKINQNSARAHLGVAANKRIEGGEALSALAQALKINPNYVEARTFAASLDLESEKYGSASTLIDEAIKINPNSLDAHSLRAAGYWLQNRQTDYENELKAVFAINPRYGKVYEVLAHFATQTRQRVRCVSSRGDKDFSAPLVGASRIGNRTHATWGDCGRPGSHREIVRGGCIQHLGQEHSRSARFDEGISRNEAGRFHRQGGGKGSRCSDRLCNRPSRRGAAQADDQIQIHAAGTYLRGDIPQSRGFRRAGAGIAGTRSPWGLLRQGDCAGFAFRPAGRPVQLGQHTLARIYTRHHAANHRSHDSALVFRGTVSLRGAQCPPGLGRRLER